MSDAAWMAIALVADLLLTAFGFCYLRALYRERRRLRAVYACANAALLICGIAFFAPSQQRIGCWLLFPLLTLISAEDFAAHRIANKLLLALLAIGILAALMGGSEQWLTKLAAPLIYGAIFVIVSLISRGSFGMGDAKLIAVLAVYYGMIGMFTLLFVASLAACICGVFALIQTRDLHSQIPFAPALEIGALAALIWAI